MKQRLHPQIVAEISRHSVLSGDRIRQCETSSGSRHKYTDQCLSRHFILQAPQCPCSVRKLQKRKMYDYLRTDTVRQSCLHFNTATEFISGISAMNFSTKPNHAYVSKFSNLHLRYILCFNYIKCLCGYRCSGFRNPGRYPKNPALFLVNPAKKPTQNLIQFCFSCC